MHKSDMAHQFMNICSSPLLDSNLHGSYMFNHFHTEWGLV